MTIYKWYYTNVLVDAPFKFVQIYFIKHIDVFRPPSLTGQGMFDRLYDIFKVVK